MKSDLIDIACIFKHETEKAVLIHDGDREAWLPKANVQIDRDRGGVTLPEWRALEKALI